MPEVIFTIQLPDGVTKECYSPSTVVRNYFTAGEELSVSEFLIRSRSALTAASERVREKFGYSCSSAQMQVEEIGKFTAAYPGNATIRILHV